MKKTFTFYRLLTVTFLIAAFSPMKVKGHVWYNSGWPLRCFIGFLFSYLANPSNKKGRRAYILIPFIILFSIFLSQDSFGAIITSNATGNWSVVGTWVGGVIPISTDDVIIASGHTVTLTAGITRTGSLTVTGTLQLAGFSMTSGDLQGAGTITSSSGTPTLTTGSNNTSTTFSGVIGTGAIAVTKNGTGALTLSGSNTYTGLTTIAAGTLKLGSATALGTTAGATSVTSGAVIDLNGTNYTNTETLTLNGTGISIGGALINSNATAATYAGNIGLGTAPRITADNPITLSGVISGTSDLTTAGTSTILLSGANTNSGLNILIAGSTLKLGNAAALGSVASADYTVVNSGAVLDLNGTNYSGTEFLRLYGSGISGAGCLINSSATTATYAGKIDLWSPSTITTDNPIIISGQVASSSHGIIKAGASSLKFTFANTHTWQLDITAGTFIVGNAAALGASNATTVRSGAVLDLNGFTYTIAELLTLNGTGINGGGALINSSGTPATFPGLITLASASSIVGETGTIAITGAITGAGFGLTIGGAAGGSITSIIGGTLTTVTKIDAGTWTLSGLNTYTGSTTVSGGILRATNNTIVASTNGAFGNNASGLFLDGGTIQSNVATFSRPVTVTATNSGLDAYGAARTISSAITLATAGSFNLNMGGATAASAEGQDLTPTGVISNSSGTLSLTKIGTSKLILTVANTFSGGTTLSDGQLNINHATGIGSGAFTITGGTIDNTTAGSITLSNNNTQNWNGNFTFTGTQPLNSGTGDVTFGSNCQATISANTFTVGGTINSSGFNLTKAGSGTLSFVSQAISLNSLTVSAGTLTSTSGSLSLSGNFTNNGTFTNSSGTVNFNGSSLQTISGTTAPVFNNMTINNAAGISLAADVTYNATLTLTNGIITTATSTLIASSTGSVSRTSGHVYGNFKKWITTGTNVAKTFQVGTSTDYTPIDVTFASVSVAGYLTGISMGGDHPNIGTSTLNASKSVNRYWTLTNSTIVFTNYSATFTFVSGDIDAGATTSTFIVGNYNGSSWTYPAVGTLTTTTTQATGLTAFGAFQVGELASVSWGAGAATTNWADVNNWSTGSVPDSTKDITISSGLSYYPVISSAASVRNINIVSGASLIISGATLKIAGSISNAGVLNATNGTINMIGSSAQTIPTNAFTNNTILNLIISNDVTLAGQDSITGTLSFGGRNKTFSTGGFLTLKSTINNTARVADITNAGVNSGNTISGYVIVERFILAQRAWRLLTAPISSTGAQTIKAAWQEGQSSGNTLPDYGTQITGGTTVNGFDQSSNNNSSLKKYDNATNLWSVVATTNAPITDSTGYMLFVRGSRAVSPYSGVTAQPDYTVLRSTGSLKLNNQSFTVAPTNFTIIGNPYASPIDLHQITKTNVQDNFYLWDPKITGTNGVGGYVNISWNGSSYDITPSSGGSGLTQYIQSGSAFFARSANGTSAGTLVIKETDKSNTASMNANRKAVNTAQTIKTNLYSTNADGTTSIVDGTLNSYADMYSNNIDNYDAVKLNNFSETLSTLREGKYFVAERRQPASSTDTIFLNMLQMKVKSYQFNFIADNFNDNSLSGFLEDSYTNTSTLIDLRGTTTFNFSVIDVPGSWNPNRFRIVFKQATALPVTFSSIAAVRQNNKIKIEWQTENEADIKQYDIERSTDGRQFAKAKTIMPEGNNNAAANYNWLDETFVTGNNYYRIKSLGINGENKYSAIVKVYINLNNDKIIIYQNPVINNVIKMQFDNQYAGIYAVKLLNSSGQLIFVKKIDHVLSNGMETITMDRNISKGAYQLQIIKPDGLAVISSLLIY